MNEYDINFNCTNCDAEIVASNAHVGMDIKCPKCEAMLKVPIPSLNPGIILGEFKLVRRIGIGGISEVWLAEQKSLNRAIALKILLPYLATNERFVNRFLAEANMSAQLEHPNILTVYSAGRIGKFYYLATSFIDKVELNTPQGLSRKMPEHEALKITKAIASALRYAWDQHQMIHRDIKPVNIMFDAHGTPRLLNFGISKVIKWQDSNNRESNVFGTPEYGSPEQLSGSSDIDFRSDIYSLGITLFQLISGLLPFQGESVEKTIGMQKHTPFPERDSFKHSISSQAYTLIELMTLKNPADRHRSWDYLISDLDLVLQDKMPVGKINRTSNVKKIYTVSNPNAKITIEKSREVRENKQITVPIVPQEKQNPMEPSPIPNGVVPPPQIYPKPFFNRESLKRCIKALIIGIIILCLTIVVLKVFFNR